MSKTLHFATLLLLGMLLTSCKSCKEPLESDTTPEVLYPPYVFYGQDFLGHYESDSTFSNGVNVSAFVKVSLDLQSGQVKFLYKEENPTLGTSFTDEMTANGGFNLNQAMDTLFFSVFLSSYVVYETVWHDGGPDMGSYSTTEPKTIDDYKQVKMPFRRVAPGKYVLEREYNGATQKYLLTKW